MMKITDLNGIELEIDNLPFAIMQADDYRRYTHLQPGHQEADVRCQAYWEDINQKLLKL